MKNIAIIIPCLSHGGAEKAAGQLSIFLSKKYNVYLFVMEDYEVTYEYAGKIINFHLNTRYQKLKKSKNIFKKIFAKFIYFKIIKEMKKTKKKYNIAVSISFLEVVSVLNIFSKVKDKIIVSVRNNNSLQVNSKRDRMTNRFIKLFYNKADKIVSVSYGVTEDLIDNFKIKPSKIVTINNFYDFDNIRKKANEPLIKEISKVISNRDKILFTMGRLVPQKNLLSLIEIVSDIIKENKNIKFIIFGSGYLEKEIRNLIKKLDLEKNIYLFNYQSNPFPIIKKSDIFIMNSIHEGFCNSIIEAMACETFVISTDCKSSPREIIAAKTEYKSKINKYTIFARGILTPVNNKEEMKKAIIKVLNDNELRKKCVKEAKKYIDNYSNEKLLEEWYKIID